MSGKVLNFIIQLVREVPRLISLIYVKNVLCLDTETFALAGSSRRYAYFYHRYNLGYPGKRMTERTVELSLADAWLERCPDAWEIGAVTPYYWPRRVQNVVDPTDKHPLVNYHGSLFDFEFTGKDLLLISTVEHIGLSQYGITDTHNSLDALTKVFTEARNFLITIPVGWNATLDEYLFSGAVDGICNVRFLVRNRFELWEPAHKDNARIAYGGDKPWANAVIVLERGNIL